MVQKVSITNSNREPEKQKKNKKLRKFTEKRQNSPAVGHAHDHTIFIPVLNYILNKEAPSCEKSDLKVVKIYARIPHGWENRA